MHGGGPREAPIPETYPEGDGAVFAAQIACAPLRSPGASLRVHASRHVLSAQLGTHDGYERDHLARVAPEIVHDREIAVVSDSAVVRRLAS